MEARWDTHPRWHEEGVLDGRDGDDSCMYACREGGRK